MCTAPQILTLQPLSSAATSPFPCARGSFSPRRRRTRRQPAARLEQAAHAAFLAVAAAVEQRSVRRSAAAGGRCWPGRGGASWQDKPHHFFFYAVRRLGGGRARRGSDFSRPAVALPSFPRPQSVAHTRAARRLLLRWEKGGVCAPLVCAWLARCALFRRRPGRGALVRRWLACKDPDGARRARVTLVCARLASDKQV